ncbi:tyrosine-type recombinase/integrase [Kitasatospora sp. NPDC057692]|uniref:tyrosine-type recombinase/integrase n=1 Tax=Kitasatospora sp. NPDC057692 TaxID=3346215 RepID=UPI00368B5757
MPGYIEDRWMTKRPDPATGQKKRTSRYGQGKRYRVCGIPGVKDESFHKQQDAKDWLASAQTDSRRGNYIDPRLGAITLRVYVETIWWPARRDPVGTSAPMRSKIWNHILPHLGEIPLTSLDAEHLRAWLAILRDKPNLSESTIEVIWIHLTSILKTAVGKRIAKNPCSEMADERPSGSGEIKARAWTPDEARAIRMGLPDWYRVSTDLGIRGGLRQGEAFGWSMDDLDLEAGEFTVARQLRWDGKTAYFKLPKGNKERRVPLSEGLHKALKAHARDFPSQEVTLPWFGPGNGGRATATVRLLLTTWFYNPINPNSFNPKAWKPALVEAGLLSPQDTDADGSGWEPSRELMFHRCRHTYASVQLRAGEDPVSLSHWMGHASPDITFKTYAHFMPERGRRGRLAVDSWLDA